MPIANAYNPNPSTVDSLLRQRQTRVDLGREQGAIPQAEPATPTPTPQKFFGVEQTPDYENKGLGRKVLEDAALLSYAIPVGLAQAVTHPISFLKEAPGAIVQSAKDVIDPEYYKAHPLLGVVNLAGFVAPIAGFAKSATVKTAFRTAVETGVKESVSLGLEEGVARSALSVGMKEAGGILIKKGALGDAVWQAAKTGKVEIVTETVKNLLKTSGVTDEIALRVATSVSDNLYSAFSRQTTKMKVLETLTHPISATTKFVSETTDPIRAALFGSPAESAVAKLYGAETVAKNPEGFAAIERWADAQVKEQGLDRTVANRQRVMQNWVDQNSEWAALTPEQRIAHFENYAKSDLTRLAIFDATGIDVVTVKALPQNYVDAMVQTIKDAPAEFDTVKLSELMTETYGRDFTNHQAEINKALLKGKTNVLNIASASREDFINAVSKLGDKRASISFAKFSPEVQSLANELEKTGYRIGHAPTSKEVSFATDVFQGGVTEKAPLADKIEVGATSFRGRTVSTVKETLPYYKSSHAKGFEKSLTTLANESNVKVTSIEKSAGIWDGKLEPSFFVKLKGNIDDVIAYLGKTQEKIQGKQDAFVAFKAGAGEGAKHTFSGIQDTDLAVKAAITAGIRGATGVHGKDFIVYDIDNSLGAQIKTLEGLLKAKSQKTNGTVRFIEKSEYTAAAATSRRGVGGVGEITPGRGQQPGEVTIPVNSLLVKRTAFGNWIDRLGLSPSGIIEGSAEFAYRENFTQGVLGDFAKKYGNVLKAKSISSAGQVSIPIEKLFEWLDKNKAIIHSTSPKYSLPARTVFDLNEADLWRAGFTDAIAKDIVGISKKAFYEVPAAVTGMGDKVVNFLRTRNKGYNAWMTNTYEKYLKVAYKGRYDLSPFFSAQEFVETKLNSALFLKDPRRLAGAATAVSGTALGFAGGAVAGAAVAGVPGAIVGGGIGLVGGQAITKLGTWTAESLSKYLGENTAIYLRKIIDKPGLQEVVMVKDEILGTLQKTMLDYASSPDIIGVQNAAMGNVKGLAGEAAFEQSIKSRNLWFALTGQSSVRMATTFNKALAEKFGMTLETALDFTTENGKKVYKNPQMVQIMRDATQEVFHYKPGFLTSPLVKTMNIVWFPFRFEAKTVSLISKWAAGLSPASRLVVLNNWVHFANWAGTDEGIKWRRTNRNALYNVFSYVTAYEQMGQGLEAVSKGRLFGGNAGLIGAVPFGFVVNLARELALIPGDTDQYDPKTGRQFQSTTPRKVVSAASFANAVEQLLISISPSTPFYSLTGGVISGVSPRKIYESLVRQVVGSGKAVLENKDPARGRQLLERDFKKVPLDYSRLTQ